MYCEKNIQMAHKIISGIVLSSSAILLASCGSPSGDEPSDSMSSSSAVVSPVSSSSAPTLSPSSVVSSLASSKGSSSSVDMASSSSTSGAANSAVLTIQENKPGFCGVDGTESDTKNAGFTGDGYADTDNNSGAAVRWSVEAKTSDRYTLELRFANGGMTSRPGELRVNGGSNGAIAVDIPVTGAWTSWQSTTVTVELIQGVNSLELVSTTDQGLGNVDSLKVRGNGVSTAACVGASNSSASSNSSSPSKPVVTLPPPSGEMMGWATDKACGPNGTTGGGSGEPSVIVTNGSEFKAAMSGNAPKVIGVKGKLPGQMSIKAQNKTVIGIGSNAQIDGGFKLTGSKNIIFKNMTFSGGSKGQSIDDAFELSGSSCIWFDHNTFRDGGDGNQDLVRASNYITNSWNKYYYTKKHGHMLSNLIGNSDNRPTDKNTLKVTFYGNHFGAGIRSRSPRVRYGQVHLFNNYWHYESVEGSTGNYAIGGGQECQILIENNHFDGIARTSTWMGNGTASGKMIFKNNIFDNAGSKVERGPVFTPPYGYTMMPPADVKAKVLSEAGPR